MERIGGFDSFNRFFIWFSNLAYLNFLWVVFTLAGGIVIGIAPSTAALFAVIRKLFREEDQTTIPIMKTFFMYFRKDFGKINLLFYLMALIGAILFLDIRFLLQQQGTIFLTMLLSVLFMISLAYLITCIFLFPVFVHFDLSVLGYLKQSFFVGIIRPFYVLLILIGLVASYIVLLYMKTLSVFFGISLGAFIIMNLSNHLFKRIQVDG